jgi:hypothetical protein
MLGAIVVAVLAVFGVIGLQQSKTTEAANITGITGCNGTIIVVGGTCDFTITFFDDWSAMSGVQATAFNAANVQGSGTLATVSNTCLNTTVAIAGNGTSQIFMASDGNLTTNCDGIGAPPASQATEGQNQYMWTIRYTCTVVGQNYVAVTAPAAAGGATLAALAAASVGSLSPGLPRVDPAFGVPYTPIQCVTSLPTGNSTLSIRKIDQFGQPIAASFSIQAGPFWTEVVRVNLAANITQNPCATDGTQGSWNFNNTIPTQTGMPAVQYGTNCAAVGVITPNILPNGLPAGQYRVVEIAGPNSYCTLVQVYNGNQSQNQSLLLPYSGAMLTQPVTVNLPDANILDLQLTFVNSCIVPGGPSTATSQIAVVIGGSTAGLVNTSNVEIVPAPGSDDDARLDIRIRDAASIPIPNAHVTVLIDKGALGLRRDFSTFPNSGYDVIEPVPAAANFASPFSGDTCDQSTNGWLTQSATTGGYSWPFLSSSRQQADGYTNSEGVISACVFVDTVLAPGTTPGKVNVQAIVESPGQGGLYNPGGVVNNQFGYNPYYPLGNNLSLPNYLGVPNIVLTATITVVGPPASITVAAAPTSLNCGEKATITVTVKDSAGQNVSDRTRVELVTNFGGVIGGTTATLGPVSVAGGNVYPVSSSSAETFNGVATAYLLTSTDHVGPYEVVAAAGGSVMASNGYLSPWYAPGTTSANNLTPNTSAYYPWYNQGLLTYSPSSAPVNAQATVTCSVPGAPAGAAAPIVTAPRTGQGPADAFAIRPPNTGDAGLMVSDLVKGIRW